MSDIKFLICKCCGAWHDDGSKEYCFKCLELSEEERIKKQLLNDSEEVNINE